MNTRMLHSPDRNQLNLTGEAADRGGCVTTDRLVARCRTTGIEVWTAELGDMQGILQKQGAGWRLFLNRDDSLVRQRFTLALGLAHVLGGSTGTVLLGGFVGDAPDGGDTVYRVAEGLLMPADLLKRELPDRQPPTETVVDLASRLAVSPLALSRRLLGMGYWLPSN